MVYGPGDLELPLAGFGHADFVDRERDNRGAMCFDERHNGVDPLTAILHVDGVDDPSAGNVFQRGFDDVRFGRIDDERRLHRHR